MFYVRRKIGERQCYPLPGEIKGVGVVILNPHLAGCQLRSGFPLCLSDPLACPVGRGHPEKKAATLKYFSLVMFSSKLEATSILIFQRCLFQNAGLVYSNFCHVNVSST